MTGMAWAKNPMLSRLHERDHKGESTLGMHKKKPT